MGAKSKSKAPEMTLGALVAHPLRSQCLTLLAERTASPAEIAVELGENLGNVSYHVRKLWRGGVIEIVEEKPVRGAMEHFYRATKIPIYSNEELAEASLEARTEIARQALSLLAANVSLALESKKLVERPDLHCTRVPMRIDEEGWGEMRDLFEETLNRIFEIQTKTADRLGVSEETGFPIVAFNTFFEMPERPKAD